MGAVIRNFIMVLALIVGIAFGFLNVNPATVDLLWGRVDAPLVVLLAGAFVIGVLLGLIACTIRIMRLREELVDARRDLARHNAPASKTKPATGSVAKT